jgi:hypothetical protein
LPNQGSATVFVFLFFLIALLSEIVGTIGGFGSSVFFVPLAGLFFDFHTVLALTSILQSSVMQPSWFFSDGTCSGDCSAADISYRSNDTWEALEQLR